MDDNEYDGQWKSDYKHGEVIYKNAASARIEKRLYEHNCIKEILEVIKEGDDMPEENQNLARSQ